MNQIFRIIIIDDHPHGREGIRQILQMDDDFEIVAEGQSGKEAIALTEQHMPDIVLMDINMPLMNGLEATKIIKEQFPYVKIVIVTVSDDITNLFEAIKRGAQGYLLKNLNPSYWHEYLKAVAVDETPMSKELAFQLLKEFAPKEVQVNKTSPLTAREQEVLEWVAKGYANRNISEELNISEHTVKNHLKNIMHKLHMDNRVQLTRYAFEQGWIKN
jgi:DNA-binding NarL/FixJ family response regulator